MHSSRVTTTSSPVNAVYYNPTIDCLQQNAKDKYVHTKNKTALKTNWRRIIYLYPNVWNTVPYIWKWSHISSGCKTYASNEWIS